MNILVCIKQVPGTAEIKIDPVINASIGDDVPNIADPLGGYTLGAAARIRDVNPDTKIMVVSMGSSQATNALKECLVIAADKAYLVPDRASGGSGILAASYILSHTIRKIKRTEGEFGAIFCDKQAIDGNTVQVGPEIAERLGLPQMTYALETGAEGDTFRVSEEGPDYNVMIGIAMPCLIAFIKPGFDPCYPSIRRRIAASRAVIPVLTITDLPDIDLVRAGLKGSSTKVKKSPCPKRKKSGVTTKEDSDQVPTAKLVQMLSAARLIQGGGDTADGRKDKGFMGID